MRTYLKVMVNTFVPYSDFESIARCLDNRRLGKQRVEAYQILLLIYDYEFLMTQYGTIETDTVRDLFLSLNRRYAQENIRWTRSITAGIPVYHIATEADKSILRGYQYHPVVRMWWGYKDALKLYLNTMIFEFIRRGFRNTMHVYALPDKILFPI